VLVLLPVDKVAQRKWFVVHISGHAIVDMEYHRQRAHAPRESAYHGAAQSSARAAFC